MDRFSSIRVAEQSDAEEITRLCIELDYPVSCTDIESRLLALRETDNRFIAVAPGDESKLLGWVAAEHRLLLESGERVEIVGLVVDPSARRQGIGRALVSAVESWTAGRGLSTVFVRSNATRDDSHHFYRGIGYDRIKTQHAYVKRILAV